jgi:hypothetical protein
MQNEKQSVVSPPPLEDRDANGERIWHCRFHPFDWWHEVGCPHMDWSQNRDDKLIAKGPDVEAHHL